MKKINFFPIKDYFSLDGNGGLYYLANRKIQWVNLLNWETKEVMTEVDYFDNLIGGNLLIGNNDKGVKIINSEWEVLFEIDYAIVYTDSLVSKNGILGYFHSKHLFFGFLDFNNWTITEIIRNKNCCLVFDNIMVCQDEECKSDIYVYNLGPDLDINFSFKINKDDFFEFKWMFPENQLLELCTFSKEIFYYGLNDEYIILRVECKKAFLFSYNIKERRVQAFLGNYWWFFVFQEKLHVFDGLYLKVINPENGNVEEKHFFPHPTIPEMPIFFESAFYLHESGLIFGRVVADRTIFVIDLHKMEIIDTYSDEALSLPTKIRYDGKYIAVSDLNKNLHIFEK